MCHVLIIEDEPLIALDLQAMLEAVGATSFDIAMTETEAVEAAQAHPPRVITSDVTLLEGTGPAAVRTIIAEQDDVSVIFITATPEACSGSDPRAVVLCKPLRQRSVVDSFKLLAKI
jgi:CheY-like chemotaxis protein